MLQVHVEVIISVFGAAGSRCRLCLCNSCLFLQISAPLRMRSNQSSMCADHATVDPLFGCPTPDLVSFRLSNRGSVGDSVFDCENDSELFTSRGQEADQERDDTRTLGTRSEDGGLPCRLCHLGPPHACRPKVTPGTRVCFNNSSSSLS